MLFAGNAIVVAVHFSARAVLQEPGGFGAGCHLRTVGSAIARESTFWFRPVCDGCRDVERSVYAALILRVAIPTGGNEQNQEDDVFHRVDMQLAKPDPIAPLASTVERVGRVQSVRSNKGLDACITVM